jgi:hypothetical protein
MLIQIFKEFTDGRIVTMPSGSILFRGGGADIDAPKTPRRAKIFLSTNNRTCNDYANSWPTLYSYIYRAELIRDVSLIHVSSMMDCAMQSLDYLKLSRSIGVPWQRDKLLDVARAAFPLTPMDGIYFQDEEGFTEVVLDNSGNLIEILDQVVFTRGADRQYAAAINRVRGAP